jgi:hypothetical protein
MGSLLPISGHEDEDEARSPLSLPEVASDVGPPGYAIRADGRGQPEIPGTSPRGGLIRDGSLLMASGLGGNARASILYWAILRDRPTGRAARPRAPTHAGASKQRNPFNTNTSTGT